MSKYYFFDDKIIKSAENTSPVMGKAEKTVTNLSWQDQYLYAGDGDTPEWEHRVSILYPYVIYNEKKYKMWYHSWSTPMPDSEYCWYDNLIDSKNSNSVDLGDFENAAKGVIYPGEHLLCYMESEDGINWIRPRLGEFFYKTKSGEIVATNIVFAGSHGLGVNKNTHPDAGKGEPAYLLAGLSYDTDQFGVAMAASPNGIHWSAPVTLKQGDKETRFLRADTHNQIFWSPERNKYVIITRSFDENGIRMVTRLEGDREAWGECEHIITGTMDAQPYSMPVARIDDGYYIGIVSVADFEPTSKSFNQVHAELIWSRDTINWQYIAQGTPFIANEKHFAFGKGNDYGMIYSSAPVAVGDKIKFFYAALPEPHYFTFDQIPENIKGEMEKTNPRAFAAESITRSPTLNIAAIGKDRFGGVYSLDGTVATNEFLAACDNMMLTCDINPGGSLSIELFDEDGNALAKKTIHQSCTDGEIFDLKPFASKKVSVKFELCDAAIFAMNL